MKESGELPNEEGDVVREYKAMHEEDFWSSWLRKDERGKEGRTTKTERKEQENCEMRKEKRRKKRTKKGLEKEDVRVSVDAFEIFSQGRDLESCGDLFWEYLLDKVEDLSDREPVSGELVRVVPDVTDVSPSSVVTELCDVSPCRSKWEFVEPQTFSFSKKRAHCRTDTQEEMSYEGLPVKAPPLSRRRMTPPTPVQNSYTSFERDQGSY